MILSCLDNIYYLLQLFIYFRRQRTIGTVFLVVSGFFILIGTFLCFYKCKRSAEQTSRSSSSSSSNSPGVELQVDYKLGIILVNLIVTFIFDYYICMCTNAISVLYVFQESPGIQEMFQAASEPSLPIHTDETQIISNSTPYPTAPDGSGYSQQPPLASHPAETQIISNSTPYPTAPDGSGYSQQPPYNPSFGQGYGDTDPPPGYDEAMALSQKM